MNRNRSRPVWATFILSLILPALTLAPGHTLAQELEPGADKQTGIRGRVGDYNGIKVVPTYHPAYLLRTPSAKKEVWEDMKLVLSLLAG